MSRKSFASAPKPVRQPSPEEIEGFEATGRPTPSVNTETRKSADTPSHLPAFPETGDHRKPATQVPAEPQTQDSVSPSSQNSAEAETQIGAAGRAIAEPIVRLTIDLPESVHTRFKAACAATRRKMVQEVRIMIEQRTEQLESVTHP